MKIGVDTAENEPSEVSRACLPRTPNFGSNKQPCVLLELKDLGPKAALALFVDEDVDTAESALNEALILAPLDERVLACCRHAEKSFGALPCI